MRSRRRSGERHADRGAWHRHGRRRQMRDQVDEPGLRRGRRGSAQSCAVGSVKSMIGHTKVTAGLAALDQSVAGAEASRAAADDRRRQAQLARRFRADALLRQHARAALARALGQTSRAVAASAPSVSAAPISTPSSRNMPAAIARATSRISRRAPPRSSLVTRADGAEVEHAAQSFAARRSSIQTSARSGSSPIRCISTSKRSACPHGEPIEPARDRRDLGRRPEDPSSNSSCARAKARRTIKAPQGIYFQDRGTQAAQRRRLHAVPGPGLAEARHAERSRPRRVRRAYALFERADAAARGRAAAAAVAIYLPAARASPRRSESVARPSSTTRASRSRRSDSPISPPMTFSPNSASRPTSSPATPMANMSRSASPARSRATICIRLSRCRGRISAEAAAADGGDDGRRRRRRGARCASDPRARPRGRDRQSQRARSDDRRRRAARRSTERSKPSASRICAPSACR